LLTQNAHSRTSRRKKTDHSEGILARFGEEKFEKTACWPTSHGNIEKHDRIRLVRNVGHDGGGCAKSVAAGLDYCIQVTLAIVAPDRDTMAIFTRVSLSPNTDS
jgi:hypothetical protein